MKRTEWWTVFRRAGIETLCSKHRTVTAAIRAASECERAGGVDHRIIEVVEAVPYTRRKR